MGLTNFPNGVRIGSAAGGTAEFYLGGTEVAVTAAELNAIHDAAGISDVEFNLLDGAIAGTVVASKAVAVDANKTIDVIVITSGTVTTLTATTATVTTDNVTNFVLGGSTVTASAAEINALASSGVSATEMARLNGIGGSAIGHPTTGGILVAAGSVALTNGTAAVSTGLATVTSVQANPVGPLNSLAGTVGGFVSAAAWSIITGTIGIQGYDYSGTLTTSAGTVFWLAYGT